MVQILKYYEGKGSMVQLTQSCHAIFTFLASILSCNICTIISTMVDLIVIPLKPKISLPKHYIYSLVRTEQQKNNLEQEGFVCFSLCSIMHTRALCISKLKEKRITYICNKENFRESRTTQTDAQNWSQGKLYSGKSSTVLSILKIG